MDRSTVARAVFASATVATVVGAVTGNPRLHAVAKPAMMPALAASVRRPSPLMGVALAAATVGDVLLIDPDDDSRILRGAGAFAVMQACYTAMLTSRGARITAAAAVPRFAGWSIAAASLATRSPGVAPGLAAYGLSLATMSTLAADPALAPGASVRASLVLPTVDDRRTWLAAGGILFTVSDAVIVFRRLALDGEKARRISEGVILATYALAQLLLVEGLSGEQ
ncbi:lysoplasmalogenase [Rhodococcoides yunnanense]|uniref:lysoplasmalogenase n=1 Tax=Rhodococcoides yunnanense TaxID=278209 RepID=UPI000933423A|nr:lysoplasmalogenase [Rhodococcus yunnanensis]